MNKIILLVCVFALCATAFGKPEMTVKQALQQFGVISDTGALTENWRELFDSFLDGAEVEKLVNNSTECVHKLELGYDDIGEAIGHFVQRGWTWENYLDFTDSLGRLTPIIRVCFDVSVDTHHDFMAFVNAFKSFWDFANQVKENVIRNMFEWYDVYSQITEAITRGRSKDIAFQIGRSTNLLLNFTPAMQTTMEFTELQDLPDLRWLEDMLKGFINGTRVLSSDRIKHCVNETEFIVQSIEDANAQFRKGTDDGFREGIFEIADIFEHLKPVNEECFYGVQDVYNTIKKYIDTFKSPWDIFFNAARNFNNIYKNVLTLAQAWGRSEWKEIGFNVGEIFYYIFFDH